MNLLCLWSLSLFVLCIVKAADPPLIQPIPVSGHLVQGQRFKLGCTVFSGSVPMQFEWFRNDRPIVPGKRFTIRSSYDESSDLIVNAIQLEDAGTYKCIVKNSVGSDSTEVAVHVKGNKSILSLYFNLINSFSKFLLFGKLYRMIL
jgi:hypothetical protein